MLIVIYSFISIPGKLKYIYFSLPVRFYLVAIRWRVVGNATDDTSLGVNTTSLLPYGYEFGVERSDSMLSRWKTTDVPPMVDIDDCGWDGKG